MKRYALLAAASLAFAAPSYASALVSGEAGALNSPVRTASGTFGDMSWTAQSLIVGMTPTASGTAATFFSGPGDPLFHVNGPQRNGVVPILTTFTGVGTFICSATAIGPTTLLTAAHCVTNGAGLTLPSLGRAFFQENIGPSDRPTSSGLATVIEAASYNIHPLYSGDVIDQNDIALIQLTAALPSWVPIFEMDFTPNLRGTDFTVYGFGGRSTVGGCGPLPTCGTGGVTAGSTGFIRQGDNMFDFRLGDPIFGTNWATILGEPFSQIEFSYISDFDRGAAFPLNDQSCRVAQASNVAGPAGAVFCNTGRGATEVSVAGGDSGGPQFNAAGKIVSVTSYGLSFGTAFGDCRTGLQSSCGEMNGFVPLYIHKDWIMANLPATPGGAIPEPTTWAMLIAGFGLVGAAARRRKAIAVA
jgi:hypothetical protein